MAHDDKDDKTSIVTSATFRIRMNEAGNTPPSIVLLVGPGEVGRQWFLDKSEYVLGRESERDIFLEDRSLSRTHAKLIIQGGNVTITDMGSSNGTEVGGKKLVPHQPLLLKDNDHIKAGNVILKYLQKGNIEALANQQSLEKSLKDTLTRIYNRRAWDSKIVELFRNAGLTEMPLTLIVFDLDKFKSINDTYGHQAGDFVLREICSVVSGQLRPSDFFARYGGEEFAIALWGSDISKGAEIAERLRASVEKHEFVYEGKRMPVTISAGVASYNETLEKWEQLFEIADQRAYASKQSGRNRVTAA